MVPDARPDVIFAQEVDRRWVDVLDRALRPAYPYAITEPREDRFGIAAYSRLPLVEARVIYLEPDRARRAPALALRIRRGSREIRLFSAHPPPPITLLSAEWRDRQIRELLTLADRERGPYALIGDLNNTPFSPVFQKWIRDSRLRNDQPPGSVYTWPSHTPALRIHIDHCLASEAVDRTVLYTGPEIGSDHFPLICELEF
jgi:endonuclease/exonuclease/phosphatase family metal-dependent hydrolase